MTHIRNDRSILAANTLGWLHDAEGPALNRYARQSPGPLVELGSFAGKSTVWIGDGAEAAGQPLFAIDWHRGSPEMAPDRECHIPEAVDPRTGRHDTLALFRSTIEQADLEDTVVPIVGTSQLVGSHWGAPLGFCFIDACHDALVIDDHMLWAPHVMPGGFLLFHDSPIPAITAAIEQAVADGFQTVEVVDSLTILRRP